MQVRCVNCGVPFQLRKEEIHAALDMLQDQELAYYSARCPHCRKPVRISREQLQKAAPDWEPSAQETESN